MQCNNIQYLAVHYNTAQHNTIQFHEFHYNTVKHDRCCQFKKGSCYQAPITYIDISIKIGFSKAFQIFSCILL